MEYAYLAVEGEDLQAHIDLVERSMDECQVPEDDRVSTLGTKLLSKWAVMLDELWVELGSYREARASLLENAGYGRMKAARMFYSSKWEDFRGMQASAIIRRGKTNLLRFVTTETPTPMMMYELLFGWLYNLVPARGRQLFDERCIDSLKDVTRVLDDFIRIEENTRKESRKFERFVRPQVPSGGHMNSGVNVFDLSSVTCFRCGEKGHKANYCNRPDKKFVKSEGFKVVCYNCGEAGHTRPACPHKNSQGQPGKPKGGDSKPKITPINPVRRADSEDEGDVILSGMIGGCEAKFLLDSGAGVTIVPKALSEEYLNGGTKQVLPYSNKTPLKLKTASIPVVLGGMEWVEEVVVAGEDVPCKKGQVLYALKIRTDRGKALIAFDASRVLAEAGSVHDSESSGDLVPIEAGDVQEAQPEVQEIQQVVTRGMAKAAAQQESECAEAERVERPLIKFVSDDPSDSTSEVVQEGENDTLGHLDEGWNLENFFGEMDDPSVDKVEEVEQVEDIEGQGRERVCAESERVELPALESGNSREELYRLMKQDVSLEAIRSSAKDDNSRFYWERGLLLKSEKNAFGEVVALIVTPPKYRSRILSLAHDALGHPGIKRTLSVIRRKFWWPGVTASVKEFCASCEVCARFNRGKRGRAPMVVRATPQIPFESMAMDIVGPFPKAREVIDTS